MTDPAARLAALRLLADELERMMARMAPGTPEYSALFSASQAYRRAQGIVQTRAAGMAEDVKSRHR